MAGRPSKYNEKIAARICAEIASSTKSLKTICDGEGMPAPSTVFLWLSNNQTFSEQYTRAREAQADFMCEEMLEIADDGTNDFMTITKGKKSYNIEDKEVTSRSKLRVETRKWLASKLKPKKYADRILAEHTGKDGGAIQTESRILSLPIEKLSQIEQILTEANESAG